MHQARYGIDPARFGSTIRHRDGADGAQSFLIVDDHALVRYGLSLAIRQRFATATVFEAGSLAEGLRKVKSVPNLTAVLYDLHMDDSNELVGLETMLAAAGDIPLVVVSGANDSRIIAGCIRAGARGFVPKGCDGAALDQALPIVLGGGIYAPAPPPGGGGNRRPITISQAAVPTSSVGRGTSGAVNDLTDRQRQVLRLLLDGQSNKEIARALGVLEGTIKVHLRMVMQRLGARNRTQLALAAMKAGLEAPRSERPDGNLQI